MITMDKDLIKEMAKNEKRIDNRKFDEFRKITIEPGYISSAEGSAHVCLGDTEVVAGVKMDLGEPYPDIPEQGTMMVAVEFVPLASPEFESGPPRENSIEVSRVVDRAIRESKMIDFEKLCIIPGEKVWTIFIDIDVINNDGNLIDACGIAAVSALMNAKMPDLDEEGKPIYERKGSRPLPLNEVAVSTTFVKISDKIIADPNMQEEEALEARLTVGTTEKDGKVMLASMQKGGSCGFTLEEIETIIGMAEEHGKEIRKTVQMS